MRIMDEERRATTRRVVPLCFLAASLEGIDIQSMGVAAPKLAPALHLAPGQIGLALSASIVGLMAGAAIGGRLADRFGLKIVLLGALIALGIFSLVTTLAYDLPTLLAARVAAGLGIGGVFPCLIALVSATAPPHRRATALSLMYAGLSVGGALAGGLAAYLGSNPDWRPIFYLGGVGPLVLVPILWAMLKIDRQGSAADRSAAAPPVSSILFGERTAPTLLLWVGYFFTLLVVYLLLNWLPSLLVGKGFSKTAALGASMIFNVGAVIGTIGLGSLMDRGRTAPSAVITYVGIAVALAGLAFLQGSAVFIAAFFAGLFAVGGQLVLYALAPGYYPVRGRGTGIGAAVAVGRLGSILGPIAAGQLLGNGLGPAAVLLAAIPGLAVALVAILAVLRRPSEV